MSKYKVENSELKKELINYIDTCEFEWTRNKNNGKWKKKIVKRGYITENLGKMVWTIAEGLSTKGNWRSYTWREDFVSQAVLTTLKYMHNFDPNTYDNAHGYINMICYNAFVQYTKKENSHSGIKQNLYDRKDEIEENGLTVDYEQLSSCTNKK